MFLLTLHILMLVAYDAPKIWNDLPVSVHLLLVTHSERSSVPLCKRIPVLIPAFSWSFSLVLTPAMPLVNDYGFLISVLCAYSLSLDED